MKPEDIKDLKKVIREYSKSRSKLGIEDTAELNKLLQALEEGKKKKAKKILEEMETMPREDVPDKIYYSLTKMPKNKDIEF